MTIGQNIREARSRGSSKHSKQHVWIVSDVDDPESITVHNGKMKLSQIKNELAEMIMEGDEVTKTEAHRMVNDMFTIERHEVG